MSEALLLSLVFVAGGLAGLAAGLLGVGGGIIIVPVLFLLFSHHGLDVSQAMPMAIGTSLATIIFTGTVSAVSHHQRGNVDWSRVRSWGWYVAMGSVLGAALASIIGGEALKVIFGLFLVLMSVHLWRQSRGESLSLDVIPARGGGKVAPVIIGSIAALLGVGGGLMLVPLLQFLGYTLHRAVATSAAFGVLVALPGAIMYAWTGLEIMESELLSIGYINGPALLLIALASVFATPLGVRLHERLQVQTIKRVFAVLTLIMGIRLVLF